MQINPNSTCAKKSDKARISDLDRQFYVILRTLLYIFAFWIVLVLPETLDSRLFLTQHKTSEQKNFVWLLLFFKFMGPVTLERKVQIT
jgi:hypothetical protein